MRFASFCFIFWNIFLSFCCDGYRILGVFPFNAMSHNIVFEALMKGLAEHGHQVDVITHFPLKKPMKNYNDIINLNGTMENLLNNFTMEFVSKLSGGVTEVIAESYGNRICHFLSLEPMQRLIKNPPKDPSYDVVITEAFGAQCYLGLGYVFKVPVVAISSSIEYPWVSQFIGNDDNPAYVPNSFHIGVGRMSFYERLKNVVFDFIESRKFHIITGDSQTESMRKYLSPDIPHIREVEKNVALTLVNSNPILFGVKPITPALIQIGGLHIEANKQDLKLELKKWMEESTDGVIFFTLGSMVLIETLPTDQLKEIYTAFEKLAPVRVLMKIVDSKKLPPGLPSNVKISSWLPQQAILAHKNTKVFITHGGLGGLEEALHFGVPMIGIPLFSDQFRNVENFVAKNIMVRINLNELSEKSLSSALNLVLKNPSYKKKAEYYSKLFRDQPLSPMKNAIFWIEYVIRNGAHVLRSPALDLNYWQLKNLDIYGFLLLISFLVLLVISFGVKILLMKCVKSREADTKTKKVQ